MSQIFGALTLLAEIVQGRERVRVIALLAVSLSFSFLDLGVMLLISQLQGRESKVWLILALGVLLFRWVFGVAQLVMGAQSASMIRTGVIRAVGRFSLSSRNRRDFLRKPEQLHRMLTVLPTELSMGVFLPFVSLFTDVLSLIAVFFALLYFLGPVAGLGLASAGLLTIGLWLAVRRVSIRRSNAERAALEAVNGDSWGFVSNLRQYQVEGLTDPMATPLFDHVLSLEAATGRSQWWPSLPKSILESASLLGLMFVVSQGAVLDRATSLVAYALLRALPIQSRLVGNLATLSQVLVRTNDLIEKALSGVQKQSHVEVMAAENFGEYGVEVELRSIQLPRGLAPKLSEGNWFFPPSSIVLVVGESGAGKTTMFDALVGVEELEDGVLLIDGVSADDFLAKYPGDTAAVVQDPYLFASTARDNIIDRSGRVTNASFVLALEVTDLLKHFERYGRSLDESIGDRGESLSGGQKQRLAIARAVARRPRLLILDEATSALDPASERLIMSRLAGLDRRPTIFVTSHRPENIREFVTAELHIS